MRSSACPVGVFGGGGEVIISMIDFVMGSGLGHGELFVWPLYNQNYKIKTF